MRTSIYFTIILTSLVFSSCNSIKNGLYEGEVEDWIKKGGEYPIEFFEFKKKNNFRHYELFCFITFYGEGQYEIINDSIKLSYTTPKSIITSKNITDTIVYKAIKVKKDALLINNDKFIWTKRKSDF